MSKIKLARQRLKLDYLDHWLEIDPVILLGEMVLEIGESSVGSPIISYEIPKIKIGDGIKKYSELPYLTTASDDNGEYKHIPLNKTVVVGKDIQHLIYGDVIVDGTLIIDEEFVILNGNLIVSDTGHVENPGRILFVNVPEGTNENFYGNIKQVKSGETIHIGRGRQNIVFGNMYIAGKLHVWGSTVVVDGNYIIEGDGEIIIENGGTSKIYNMSENVFEYNSTKSSIQAKKGGCIAYGQNNFTVGNNNVVNGNASCAFGTNSISSRNNEIVLGTEQFEKNGDAQHTIHINSFNISIGSQGEQYLGILPISKGKSYNFLLQLIGRSHYSEYPYSIAINARGLISVASIIDNIQCSYFWEIIENDGLSTFTTSNNYNNFSQQYISFNNGKIYITPFYYNNAICLKFEIINQFQYDTRWVATWEMTEVESTTNN